MAGWAGSSPAPLESLSKGNELALRPGGASSLGTEAGAWARTPGQGSAWRNAPHQSHHPSRPERRAAQERHDPGERGDDAGRPGGWRETESRCCSRGEPCPKRRGKTDQAGRRGRTPVAGLDGSQDPRRGSPVSASWRAPLKTFSLCSLTQPRVLRRLERKPTAAAISGSMSVLFPVQRAWLMS